MKSIPSVPSEARRRIEVRPDQTIALGPRADAPVEVFSTPSLILLLELAAKDLLAPHLEAEEDSVGVSVEITHTAPTPRGGWVEATARLVAVQGRQFDFELLAFDAAGEIGNGRHRRAVVSLSKFEDALAKRTSPRTEGLTPTLPAVPATVAVRGGVEAGVARLVLNRPGSLNAMDRSMTGDLEAWLAYLEHPTCPVRVVVLSGEGRAFCAGEDIKENAALDADASIALAGRRGQVCRRLAALPHPVIAQVQGPCFGGGLMLALAADLLVASHSATFGLPEVKLGWPPAYTLDAVVARVGRLGARRLALQGETWTAAQALELGLVDRAVAENQLPSEGARAVNDVLRLPALAFAETKRLLADLGPAGVGGDLGRTLDAYARCRRHPDAAAGMRAFLEGRNR
ncbi:MAG: enoyl-CoA hydratase/isomerase family protein [Opitutaceae bacterium]|nr:enoyl-CoA hydratase/isomerase family protein [Opitutaceae bacterium]